MRDITMLSWLFCGASLCILPSCGGGADADTLGIAAECRTSADCRQVRLLDGGRVELQCLPEFAGGYCGLTPCATSFDCPEGAICVAHTDGTNYCFRACGTKSECNRNRSLENEANCSSSFDWAVPAEDDGSKACIPPSSGL